MRESADNAVKSLNKLMTAAARTSGSSIFRLEVASIDRRIDRRKNIFFTLKTSAAQTVK
jgi:hypothetical protein